MININLTSIDLRHAGYGQFLIKWDEVLLSAAYEHTPSCGHQSSCQEHMVGRTSDNMCMEHSP